MHNQLEFYKLLMSIPGIKGVYEEGALPADGIKAYPAIVYNLTDISTEYGNNKTYMASPVYKVTVLSTKIQPVIHEHIVMELRGKMLTAFIHDGIRNMVFNIEQNVLDNVIPEED